MIYPKFTRRQFVTGLAAGATCAIASPSFAKAPAAGHQIAGAQRFAVGDIEVTAILDGHFDLDPAMLPKSTPEEVTRLQKAEHWPVAPALRGPVNTYVVNTGGRLALIDTGASDAFGDLDRLGHLHANLAAAGIAAADIDDIVLTHMHPDHLGGLPDSQGKPAFSNAALRVHQTDWDFWMSETRLNEAPDSGKFFFQVAQARAHAYADRVEFFGDNTDLGGGLTVIPAPGHTPGHSGLRVSSGNNQLLILGDIVHTVLLQFAHPDWGIAFDTDQEQAAATRARLLDMAATEQALLAGMHIPFPGIGYADRRAEGYGFVPLRWQYEI